MKQCQILEIGNTCLLTLRPWFGAVTFVSVCICVSVWECIYVSICVYKGFITNPIYIYIYIYINSYRTTNNPDVNTWVAPTITQWRNTSKLWKRHKIFLSLLKTDWGALYAWQALVDNTCWIDWQMGWWYKRATDGKQEMSSWIYGTDK